ncbi:hypothetical protein ACHQM5_015510 [Ranunculus cassubicifolius]
MDLRGQDHKRIVLPSSFIYNPPIREQPNKVPSIFSTTGGGGGGGDRRRDVGQGNGNSILSSSQAFDHHHHHQQQHQHQHHHQQQLHQQQQQSPPRPTPVPQSSLPQQQQHHHQHQQQQQQARAQTPPPPPPPPHSQQLNQQRRVPDPDPESDSDPIQVSIAATPVTSLPIGGGGSTPRTPPTSRNEVFAVRYRECLKNHAASIGGHVVDGCGEFMPGGEEGTPDSLKCAACECHRNFHRKESDGGGEPQSGANYYYYNPNSKTNGSSRSRALPPPLPAPPLPQPLQQHQKYPIGGQTSPPSAPMMMAFGGGGGSAATDSSSEEMNMFGTNAGAGSLAQPPQYGSSLSKKRFRTKFSKEQKDKMMEFADKVGWRMQKQDEPAVQQFCADVGVKRQVLKVWMHNNKHSMKKKDEL